MLRGVCIVLYCGGAGGECNVMCCEKCEYCRKEGSGVLMWWYDEQLGRLGFVFANHCVIC